MHVGDASSTREQGAHIAARLRAMQLAKGPAHLRNLDVVADVGRDDEKEPAVRSPFVQLSGRVQVPRTEAERRSTAERVPPRSAHLLELAKAAGRGRNVREDRGIIAWTIRRTKLRQRERLQGRSRLRPAAAPAASAPPRHLAPLL